MALGSPLAAAFTVSTAPLAIAFAVSTGCSTALATLSTVAIGCSTAFTRGVTVTSATPFTSPTRKFADALTCQERDHPLFCGCVAWVDMFWAAVWVVAVAMMALDCWSQLMP